MPILFILSLLVLLAGMVLVIIWLNQPKLAAQKKGDERDYSYSRSTTNYRRTYRMAAQLTLVAGVLLLGLSSLTMVGTKTVGVVTSFGKPSGTPMTSGLHVKAPWAKVHKFDAAVQVDKYSGDDCVGVRMAGQTTACVSAVVTWRIVPSQANSLYQDYKDFDRVQQTLVANNTTATLSKVFASYNPLQQVSDGHAISATPDVSGYAQSVKTVLQSAVGSSIEVVSVTTPYIKYDSTTQDRVNDLQAEVANTRVAEQKKLTAQAEAAANRTLSASVSHDPNVLVSKCLDLLSSVAQAGGSLPNGFTCWPGTSVPPVAVGSAQSK